MDLYVYYRVDNDAFELLQARVLPMQARLTEQYGVAAALKRRPQSKAGQDTWMEVYLAVPHGFEQALHQAAIEADLPALIDGDRHIEHFLDVSSCA